MNVKKIKNIKSLIDIQLEYLDNLSKERGSDFYNPDKAGFFRVSLEIQKQISRLKKERF